MNNQLKVQVALIIFIINVLVYYCILPDYRANSQESNKVESIPIESKSFKDQLSDIYCGKSNPPVNDCESALGLLKILETHCGIQKQTILFNKQTTETIATTTTATTTELNDTSSTESSLKLEKEVIIEETVAEIKSEDKPPVVEENLENVHLENIKEENTVSTEEVVTVKEHVPRQVKAKDEVGASNLIYQIIVVLLVVSVSASLADCIQERRKRRAVAMLSDPKNPANNGINRRNDPQMTRRMSLADLTMSRHARRESQASYRAPGKIRSVSRLLFSSFTLINNYCVSYLYLFSSLCYKIHCTLLL
ncbi:hypothetical protein O3M35_012145 [Rhynocoris fuscipes]|uniref:Uncharacterized protein n=1 Tax=Rhynocoris fuscipes TaxID=488301 RepID=A0AAW1CRA8_9HEMI